MDIVANYLESFTPRLIRPEFSLSRGELEELLLLIHYFNIQVEKRKSLEKINLNKQPLNHVF